MSHDLSWLPDRHLAVVATLAHADDLFRRLTDVLYEYSTQPGGTLALDEVRDAVAREWANEKRKARQDARFNELLKRYQVTIESASGTAASR